MIDERKESLAFPVVFSDDDYHSGMTLRDYFAAKAMASIIANPEEGLDYEDHIVAMFSYRMADAMLEARKA